MRGESDIGWSVAAKFGQSKNIAFVGLFERKVATSETFTEAEAANELMRLAQQIANDDQLYYAEDAPEISGEEYDPFVRRDRLLEGG